MASNKKAQILAAVMCASSIFGSYTVVSAADTPTKIESTDKNSSVTANGSTITATAGAKGSQQSTITLGNKSLAINVGKQTTTDGITYGAFSLNSSNVVVNGNRLTMKSSTSSYAADLTNAGLTIKDGKTTVASLTNAGLSVNNATGTRIAGISSTGVITGTGLTVKAASDTIKPEGNYVESKVTTSGVADTIKQGGFTRATSNVTTNSIKDTIYTDSGTELSSINVFKNTAANGIENGKVSLTAKKIVTDNQTSTTTTSTTTTSTLTLGGDNASLKVGNYGFTVDSNNNVLFSGKNASLTSTGLTVNGTGTSSIKSTNATTGAYTKNDISYAGMTTTVRGGKNPSESDNVNKTTSAVTYTGVTDTVYDDGGNLKTKSSVTTSGITNTVNDVSTGKALANSSLTTSGISNTTTDLAMTGTNEGKKMSTALYQNSNGISASATKKDENGTVGTSTLTLAGDSASLKVGSYGFAVDSNNNVSITGDNATLSGSTFTLKDANGKTATLNTSGLTLKDEDGNTTGGISTTGAVTGTSLNITAKNTAGNKTTSTVGATGVTDAVYGTDGARVAYSSVGTGGISNTTSLKTTTGKIDTAINQNTSGVGISSTKYDTNNNVTDKTSVSVNGGTSSITSYGSYIYGEDGKATSYNQASMSLNGNTGTATIRGGSNTASSTLTLNEAGVALSGKNASLSGSTFTLKDTTNGKTLASLGASGLSINNADGIKVGGISNTGNLIANDGMNVTDKNSSWVNIGTSTMQKDITATTTTSYAGITNKIDTTLAGNKTYTSGTVVGPTSVTTTVQGSTTTDAISGNKNKTTSTVSATGVTDTVYNVKGNQVASSSVTTNGIVNTTTNLSIDGSTNNTMSTSIYQDKRGISASATKKDENGTVGTSTLTLAGDSASLKVGSYGFAVDSNNNVSITGDNATLSGSTFTLKDANGKTATLNTSGLTLKDEDGNTTGGISSTGAITGTSLRITTSEDTNGNKTVSTVATNGVTDTVTNNKTNNKTTSQVSATGVRDTVYDANNKTVASSTVTTSGITNSTNISGIAIKDDKNNTKTMNTSIAQNANGVNISSTKYNVYNDGTNTVQTTDGISSISVNGAKTTISGYGYKYEKDENGKPILDEKGNPIRSSYTNASLSVDGESGIIGLSGKNVGLSANGLTLYKDVEGVKTQYASLTAGGLNVNGTGYTTIKSTNATTGAMGQSQLSYNGVTDTVTNAAGNKTTSTVNATGTIDQVYDTDGKTRIAYSNITTTGITDSFTKDGITNSVTTNANGTTFASTGNGSTTIKGGSITTNSITVAGNTIDGGFFDTIGETNSNTAGIVRTEINGDWITSIEGAINISRSGNISLNADKLTYSYNDGKNSGTLGALANKVDDIYDRTQGIDYDKATGTTTIDGNLSVKDETTTGGTAGSTGETGTTPINGNITANTANIGGVQMGNNTVTATTGNFENITVGGTEGTSINKDGVTVGDKKSDNYTSITNNDVVVNNNGNKTSLADVGNRVTGLESSVNSMNNRLSDVEDRIDKVGAMSAAIANLRTMGFDPEAPTEIAIGVGQYKSETGLALGVFHYPNQDFMLSASISTSGDEVMGGIGATWKLGRKSAAEKAKDEEARRLEKAEEMKKLAQDAKVKAQAERHAKLLAEREAQKTA